MSAIDRLEARIDALCDDAEVVVPVRFLRDVVREATALESDLEFARALLPDDAPT